jgi:DNA-binding response OmpR family regulator
MVECATEVVSAMAASSRPILLVDDDPAIRDLYRRELEDLGYSVVTANDRTSALEAAATTSPRLAVLDIRLAQESGLDLLRELLEHCRLQTILLTAYGSYRDDFSSWLADAFVLKSSDTSELKHTVNRLLVHGRNGHSAP